MTNIYIYYSNKSGRHVFTEDQTALEPNDLLSEFRYPHSTNTAWFCINVKFITEDNLEEILARLKKISLEQLNKGKATGLLFYKDNTKTAIKIKEIFLPHIHMYHINCLEFDGNEHQGFPSIYMENACLDTVNFANIYSAVKKGITIKNSHISSELKIHNLKISKFMLDTSKVENLEFSWMQANKSLSFHYNHINKLSLSQIETECLLLNNTIMTTACIVNITLLKRANLPIINFFNSIANPWVIQNIFIKEEQTENTEEMKYEIVSFPARYLEIINDIEIVKLPDCYLIDDRCCIHRKIDLLASLRKTFSIMKGSAESNFDFISSYGFASLEKGLKEMELHLPEEKVHNLGSRLLFFLSKITSNHNQSLVRVCIMYFVNIALGTSVIYSSSLWLTGVIVGVMSLLSIWFYIKSQEEAMIFLLAILFLRIANSINLFNAIGEKISLESIIVNILLPFPSFDVKIMSYGSIVAITIFVFKIFSTYLLWQTVQTSKAQFR